MTTYVLQTTLSLNLVYQVCAQARVVIYGQALRHNKIFAGLNLLKTLECDFVDDVGSDCPPLVLPGS